MLADDTREPSVWQQLRRRRVTRTVVTYVAAGYALLEVASYLLPRLGLEGDVGRVVTGIVVLGFPFAVVLAWTYDITPKGVVRTPDDPRRAAQEAPGPILQHKVWMIFCAGLVAIGFVFRSLRM